MNRREALLDAQTHSANVLVEYDSTVAVIEADARERRYLCDCLGHAGFRVWTEASPEEFCLRLLRDTADLVVMAAGEPGSLSARLTERLATEGVPVIVLDMPGVDRSGVETRGELREPLCAAQSSRGRLHLTKPIEAKALMEAINALRDYWSVPPVAMPFTSSVPWRFDGSRRCLVSPFAEIVPLTSREAGLLRCLAAQPGRLVSKFEVATAMGVAEAEGGFHRIEANLCRLRKKVKQVTGLPMPIRSEFGEGLVFAP